MPEGSRIYNTGKKTLNILHHATKTSHTPSEQTLTHAHSPTNAHTAMLLIYTHTKPKFSHTQKYFAFSSPPTPEKVKCNLVNTIIRLFVLLIYFLLPLSRLYFCQTLPDKGKSDQCYQVRNWQDRINLCRVWTITETVTMDDAASGFTLFCLLGNQNTLYTPTTS